jgi:hypothetical protein
MVGPLRSVLPLPLRAADGEVPARWSVVLGERSSAPAGNEFDQPTVTRRGDLAELVFGGTGSVVVDLRRREIEARPARVGRRDLLGNLIAAHVIPRVAADAHLVLHAAAVATPDGDEATLFVGPSGFGKSTVATQWCRRGHLLLGDDTVKIDGALAFPSWMGPRLWPNALAALGLDEGAGEPQCPGSEKRLLGAEDGIVLAERPAVVRKLVLLGSPSGSRVAAVRLLAEQALKLGFFDPATLLDRVTALVNAVPELEARTLWEPSVP